jgi:hypothetical protein
LLGVLFIVKNFSSDYRWCKRSKPVNTTFKKGIKHLWETFSTKIVVGECIRGG